MTHTEFKNKHDSYQMVTCIMPQYMLGAMILILRWLPACITAWHVTIF